MDNNSSEKHRYWANALGFMAFIFLLIIMERGCTDVQKKRIELEKVKATLNDSIRK
jgi:hypothetical protein